MPYTIVHVLGSLEVGGGEQVALNLAAGQVQKGHRVHVVSLANGREGPHGANFRNAGAVVHTVPKLGPRVDPTLPLRLGLLFHRMRADVVHTHNPLPLIYAAGAARLVKARVVHTKHGFNQAKPRQEFLRRVLASAPHAIVAVSAQTARDAVAQGECAPQDVSVIPNGISLEAYSPSMEDRTQLRTELGIPDDALVVGTVGRMSAIKNQPMLVRAVAPFLSDRLRLIIAGDGDDRPAVEAAIAETNSENHVHLLGRRLDIPRILPAFDIFALSSRSEGLPMVLPEAMACELPLVCTRVGGVPEVVVGDVGILVDEGDEQRLSEAILRLTQDPDLRRSMGQKAREIALERYSATVMVNAYLDLYRRLLS